MDRRDHPIRVGTRLHRPKGIRVTGVRITFHQITHLGNMAMGNHPDRLHKEWDLHPVLKGKDQRTTRKDPRCPHSRWANIQIVIMDRQITTDHREDLLLRVVLPRRVDLQEGLRGCSLRPVVPPVILLFLIPIPVLRRTAIPQTVSFIHDTSSNCEIIYNF